VGQALALVREVRAQWQAGWTASTRCSRSCRTTAARQLEDPDPRAAAADLLGRAVPPLLEEVHAIHKRVLKGRVWVALHMHAGDGNVHTNIPVNSDDYEMLQTAHAAVKRIMALARSLDGVISGEHGIGITKLEFLTDEEIGPSPTTSSGRPGRAASTRASCCGPDPADGRCRCTPT
jgi:FAD/FMN-containing dehydrogenase